MSVKLLTEHNLEFLSLKEAAEARPSLHLSKCLIVGNLVQRLISFQVNNKGIDQPACASSLVRNMVFHSLQRKYNI